MTCQIKALHKLDLVRMRFSDRTVHLTMAGAFELFFDGSRLVDCPADADCRTTCCCGDLVDHHGMGSGHSPVLVEELRRSIEASVDRQIEKANRHALMYGGPGLRQGMDGRWY